MTNEYFLSEDAGMNDSNSDHPLAVLRPWGSYTVLEETPSFKVKRIDVKAGASLSLQLHRHRSEHWVVVAGVAHVQNGERILQLQVGEHTYIPAGQKHRLVNPGDIATSLIEVQCGTYLGEDDIVRFADQYGRVLPSTECDSGCP